MEKSELLRLLNLLKKFETAAATDELPMICEADDQQQIRAARWIVEAHIERIEIMEEEA